MGNQLTALTKLGFVNINDTQRNATQQKLNQEEQVITDDEKKKEHLTQSIENIEMNQPGGKGTTSPTGAAERQLTSIAADVQADAEEIKSLESKIAQSSTGGTQEDLEELNNQINSKIFHQKQMNILNTIIQTPPPKEEAPFIGSSSSTGNTGTTGSATGSATGATGATGTTGATGS